MASKSEECFTVDLGEHRTTVLVRGAKDGDVVCFLHPLGLDSRAFDAVIAELAPRWRCVTFDQRGHGDSTAPASQINLAAMAADVTALLDRLDVARAHLVGHSIGGAIAATAAATAPHRFSSLALLATPDRGSPLFEDRAQAAENHGIAALVDATLDRWFTTPHLRSNGPGVEYARQCLLSIDAPSWSAAWRALARFNGYASIGSGLPPTRCIVGADDASTPPQMMRSIAEWTDADLVVVPAAAHLLTWERPREVAGALAEHWYSVVQNPRLIVQSRPKGRSMEPIFVVQFNVAESEGERWNRWYNEVHVREVMSLSDEIVSATRYRRTHGDVAYEYMVIYRFSSYPALEAFLAHPDLKRLGEDYLREWGESSERVRGFYQPIFEMPESQAQ